MTTTGSFRHLKIAVGLVLAVLALGTLGYMLIEQLSFVDALYTTIGMMATVGNVTHQLSPPGRLLTIGVIVFGVGSLLYTFGVGMEYMIEGHFSQAVRRRMMENKIARLRNHAIICGFGRVGSQIAEELAATQLPFVVIDEREASVQSCIQRGYVALQGDATSDDVLREVGIQQARYLLAATANDAHNISITLSARHLNRTLFIVARANHRETEAKLKLAGADRTHSPYTISGRRMVNLALQRGVIGFFDTLTQVGSVELMVQETVLASTSPLVGKTLLEAQNALSDGPAIVAVRNSGGFLTGSRFFARLEAGDTVIVVGVAEQAAAFTRNHSA